MDGSREGAYDYYNYELRGESRGRGRERGELWGLITNNTNTHKPT